jgi:hypothetical protein
MDALSACLMSRDVLLLHCLLLHCLKFMFALASTHFQIIRALRKAKRCNFHTHWSSPDPPKRAHVTCVW